MYCSVNVALAQISLLVVGRRALAKGLNRNSVGGLANKVCGRHEIAASMSLPDLKNLNSRGAHSDMVYSLAQSHGCQGHSSVQW